MQYFSHADTIIQVEICAWCQTLEVPTLMGQCLHGNPTLLRQCLHGDKFWTAYRSLIDDGRRVGTTSAGACSSGGAHRELAQPAHTQRAMLNSLALKCSISCEGGSNCGGPVLSPADPTSSCRRTVSAQDRGHSFSGLNAGSERIVCTGRPTCRRVSREDKGNQGQEEVHIQWECHDSIGV